MLVISLRFKSLLNTISGSFRDFLTVEKSGCFSLKYIFDLIILNIFPQE